MKVLAIPGSLRKASYNRMLLQAAAELAPAGTHVEVVEDLGLVPLFNEDVERETGGGPEPIRQLRARVAAADGLLIATPEYNHSIPGVLKNAIDWLSRAAPDEVLAGKPVAVIGTTPGRWGTRLSQAAVRQVLYATECLVLPSPAMFAAGAAELFDASGRLTDERTRRSLLKVVNAFVAWIERVR